MTSKQLRVGLGVFVLVAILIGGLLLMDRARRRAEDKPDVLVLTPPSSDSLTLGEDLAIAYHVASAVTVENLELTITNKEGTVVFSTGTPSVETGEQRVVWPSGKRNQEPNKGALANPANSPYSIQLKGTQVAADGAKRPCISNVVQVGTRLVLTATLDKSKPAPDQISSGLYRPAFDLSSQERLKIGLAPKPAGKAVFATDPPTFSEFVEADLDNNPANGLELKSVRFRQVMQPTFANGAYRVVVENLRDVAGNAGAKGTDDEGVFADWIVNLR